MKKLSLLLLVCMISMLAIAQTDSSTDQTQQDLSQDLSVGVTLTPSTVDLGNIAVGSPAYARFILTNNGPQNVTISSMSFAPPLAPYSVSSTACKGVLTPTQNCSITVQFQASATGASATTLSVHDTAGIQTTSLSAMGIHDVTLAPVGDCNNNAGGDNGPCSVILTNNENWYPPLSIKIAVTPPFSESDNCGDSLSELSSCTIVVAYPGSTGQQGTLKVTTSSHDNYPPPLNLVGCKAPHGYCQ